MSLLLQRLISNVSAHPSDEVMSRLVSGELSTPRLRKTQKHLAKCWKCRSRYEDLDRAAMGFVELHKHLSLPNPPEAGRWRDMLIARLDQAAAQLALPWWSRFAGYFRAVLSPTMNPVLASVVVVALAAITLLVIWERSAPPVSAAEFLDRAEVADSNSSHPAVPGVVYQRVHIKTPHNELDRNVYHDHERHRRPKPERVSADIAPLKTKLEIAGVNWDEPLSAASYKRWHDRQHSGTDQVKRSGKDLLTLTTKTSSGIVAGESLTVREGDFHPVKRTIELLDVGSVEIAEVNYVVLGWDAINESLFEPPSQPAAIAVAPAVSAAPSGIELEDAELQARLALNRLNADTTEQIRVTRSNKEIGVKGIVETEQRKEQILLSLHGVPHLTAAILSVEELNMKPSTSASSVTTVRQYSVVSGPSPLERYLKEKGVPSEELNRASQRLLEASLSVQRQAGVLTEFVERFASGSDLSPAARSAREEIVANHLASLRAALDAEVATLRDLGFAPAAENVPSVTLPSPDALKTEAQHSQALCQELITGGADQPRSAESIASEYFSSVDRLRVVVETVR